MPAVSTGCKCASACENPWASVQTFANLSIINCAALKRCQPVWARAPCLSPGSRGRLGWPGSRQRCRGGWCRSSDGGECERPRPSRGRRRTSARRYTEEDKQGETVDECAGNLVKLFFVAGSPALYTKELIKIFESNIISHDVVPGLTASVRVPLAAVCREDKVTIFQTSKVGHFNFTATLWAASQQLRKSWLLKSIKGCSSATSNCSAPLDVSSFWYDFGCWHFHYVSAKCCKIYCPWLFGSSLASADFSGDFWETPNHLKLHEWSIFGISSPPSSMLVS